MQNDMLFKDEYKKQKEPIGTGGFGTVYKVRHRETGQTRACKVIPKNKILNLDTFMLEIKILQKLDHPNVLKLYEYFIDETSIYLITEMCRGGELFDRIIEKEFFDENEAALLFKQILQSLNYIHSQGIAHRDIKPENFLYDAKGGDSIKIIDFGLSKILSSTPGKGTGGISKRAKLEQLGKMVTKAGTPSYVSPEVLQGNYNIDCDMWSAGCLLFILLSGYPPFDGDNDIEICQSIMKGRIDFDGVEWTSVSKEAKNLIGMLICKPEKRLTADEALQHKWFKKTLGDQKNKI